MGHLDGFRRFCEAYRPGRAASPQRRLELAMSRAQRHLTSPPPTMPFDVPPEPPASGPRRYKVFAVEQSGRGHVIKMTPFASSAVMDDAEFRSRQRRGTEPRAGDEVEGPVHADGTFKYFRILSRRP